MITQFCYVPLVTYVCNAIVTKNLLNLFDTKLFLYSRLLVGKAPTNVVF